ncbi:MAG TPA: glycosyltransferase [Proteus sp.]|nr:glycosyltransferase [Proteus sp. (in: enterobacteria)]
MTLSSAQLRKPVYWWIIGYATLWIIVSYMFDPTVPYDAVEAVNWGTNGEWGSPKNPWFVGFLMWPAIYGGIDFSFYWYFIHFIVIAIGLLGVWNLAYQLTKNQYLAWFALLGLNLSGIINFDIIPYNDNYILVGCWAWALYFFIFAINEDPKYWLYFAITMGIATMGKYSSLAIIGSVFLLSLFVPKVRQSYCSVYFYLAIAIWLAFVIPNFIWLWHNDFAAFKWVDSQIDHRFNLRTARAALTVFYPVIIMWGILHLYGGHVSWSASQDSRLLNFILLFPLAIIFVWFSFNDGGRITEWLQPFMSVATALFVGSITVMPKRSLRGALYGLGVFGMLVLSGYTVVQAANVRDAGQKFIGIKTFVQEVEQAWYQRYHTPLSYVGGEYLHEWITFYGKDRPLSSQPWLLEENIQPPNIYNRHITLQQLEDKGVVLVSEVGKNCTNAHFDTGLKHWPSLKIASTQEILFRSEPTAIAEPVCIAFVAPK